MPRGAEPPCTASPAGLFSTMTSASSYRIISLRACSVLLAASDRLPATLGGSSLSGGMRMLCPSSSRSLLSARLPLTRSSPLRTMRWMWENDRPGKRASRKAIDPHIVLVRGHDHGLNPCRQRLGGRFLRLCDQPGRLLGVKCGKARGRLAARTMRSLGPRAAIGARAFRAVARRTRLGKRFLDATAHGVFPLLNFAQ